MLEFPEIGWDELPPPAHDHEPHHQEAPHDDLHVQQELVDENHVEANQSQESIILQVSDDSVNAQPVDDMVILQQPAAPMQPPLHIGQVLTIFGPVLPPVMQ